MSRATKRQNLAFEESKRPQNNTLRNAVLIFVGVLIFIFIGVTIFQQFIPIEEPPIQANTWQGLTPGFKITPKLNSELGGPVVVKNLAAEKQQVSYRSEDFKVFYNEVIVDKDGVVEFIKIPVAYTETHTLSEYISLYGEQDFDLYDHRVGANIKAYVFLDEGLAVLANAETQVVEQLWYFEPTDKNMFMALWGSELSEEYSKPEAFPL